MIREYPDYFKTFSCIGGACPDSCCIGWEVDIDEETFYYYRALQGAFGRRLNDHMVDAGEDKYFPMTEENRCPFLNEKNLCDIILNLGEESLCQVCTEYPRYYLSFRNYEQTDMSLSCMELGRIFFSSDEPVRYCREEFPEEEMFAPDQTDLPLRGLPDSDEMCTSEERAGGNFTYEPGKVADGNVVRGWGDADAGYSDAGEKRLNILLHTRVAAIEMLEDRGKTFRERTETVLGQDPLTGSFAVKLPETERESDEQVLLRMSRLEILGDWWISELEAVNRELTHRQKKCGETESADSERHRKESRELEHEDSGKQQKESGETDHADSEKQQMEIWFEKLAVYYLFRYLPDAFPDGNYQEQKRFIRRSLRFTALMCTARRRENAGQFTVEDMIDVAHLYSKEVEHSEDNVEFLKKSF